MTDEKDQVTKMAGLHKEGQLGGQPSPWDRGQGMPGTPCSRQGKECWGNLTASSALICYIGTSAIFHRV